VARLGVQALFVELGGEACDPLLRRLVAGEPLLTMAPPAEPGEESVRGAGRGAGGLAPERGANL
jgi:hypothetical protein